MALYVGELFEGTSKLFRSGSLPVDLLRSLLNTMHAHNHAFILLRGEDIPIATLGIKHFKLFKGCHVDTS